jgi:hypothetical protein
MDALTGKLPLYNGGFIYFELIGLSVYKNYVAAAKRLGLSETAMTYGVSTFEKMGVTVNGC